MHLYSALLALNKVAKYAANYQENAQVKHKNLAESVKIADRILVGETSYESKISFSVL